MNMDGRNKELYTIHNNISVECEKMIEYLHRIKEQSENALASFVQLTNINKLKRYSSIYEFLNKLYIKVLDQNCLFEVFFLELADAHIYNHVNGAISASVSNRDLSAYNEYCFETARSHNISDMQQRDFAYLEKSTHDISLNTSDTSVKVDHEGFISPNQLNPSPSRQKCATNIVQENDEVSDEQQIYSNIQNLNAKHVENVVKHSTKRSTISEFDHDFNSNHEQNVQKHLIIPELVHELKQTQSINTSNKQNTHKFESESYHGLEQTQNMDLITEQSIQINAPKSHHVFQQGVLDPKSKSFCPKFDQSIESDSPRNENIPEIFYDFTKKFNSNSNPNIPELDSNSDKTQYSSSSPSKIDLSTDSIKDNEMISSSEQSETQLEKADSQTSLQEALLKSTQRMRAAARRNEVKIPDLRPKVKSKQTHEKPQAHYTNYNRQTERRPTKKKFAPEEKEPIVPNKGRTPQEGELCYVSYVESPSSFYIQVIREDNTMVDYLSDQVFEIAHRLKVFTTKLDAFNIIKKYCVCFIQEYGTWYRAEVLNWILEDDHNVEVRLIDHGNKCLVPLAYIRESVSYLYELPVMAEKCELAWIKPKTNTNWSEESKKFFHSIVDPDANQLFTITFVETDRDKILIDLKTNELNSIVVAMVEEGQAIENIPVEIDTPLNEFMKKQILKSQGLDDERNLTEEERLEEAFAFDDEEVADPNLAVAHYNPIDETKICRIFLSRGSCFKGKHCRFSHENLNPGGWTTDREPIFYDSFNTLQLPCAETEITVRVISVVDLRTFYVVLKHGVTNRTGNPINTIKCLVNAMNNPDMIKTFKWSPVIPAISQMVLAKYKNMWQRGRVIDIVEFASKVELYVFLVDFGEVIQINMKETRTIQEQFLHLPFQAIQCTLANVILKENMTEEENDMGSDYLEMNVLDKKLKAKVTYSAGFLSVNLFTMNGDDVGAELMKANIVEECNESFTPCSNLNLLVD